MSRRTKKHIFFKKSIYGDLVSATIFLAVFLFFVFLVLIHDMPDLDNLESKGRRASVVFESYDGKVIATYGDLFKEVVKVKELPRYVAESVVAIEDKRFFLHNGVDLVGIVRAFYNNFMAGKIVQGGSTITQQLAKNLFLSNSRSIKRKVQEFVLALWLERKFTKKQILSIYLNRMYYGAGAYGIDAAAYRYFGKQAKQLTLYESAKLSGILKSPTSYSPFYNPQKSDDRAELVLSCMKEENFITNAEMKEAIFDKEKNSPLSVPMDENRYFTDWALEQLNEIIATGNEDLIVKTTLDTRLQKNATYIAREMLNNYGFVNHMTQMALVAVDNLGAVRAMVGGHTYYTSQFNRALASRAAGSSFKYFVFLSALNNGMSIDDLIDDSAVSLGKWNPKNCGYSSVGRVSLRNAFAFSVNTATVRIAKKIGIENVIKTANDLGITSKIDKNYSSALGASGVSLLEMTSAFAVVMSKGISVKPFCIMNVKNQKGKVLYVASVVKPRKILSDDVCDKMKVLLKSVIDYGTGKRAKLPIVAHGKTGTSNDNRDANFIGFVYPLSVGVWCGNDDNTPMNSKITGGFIPAMAWKEFMLSAFMYKENSRAIDIKKDNPTVKNSSNINITVAKTRKPLAPKRKIKDLIP